MTSLERSKKGPWAWPLRSVRLWNWVCVCAVLVCLTGWW